MNIIHYIFKLNKPCLLGICIYLQNKFCESFISSDEIFEIKFSNCSLVVLIISIHFITYKLIKTLTSVAISLKLNFFSF